MALRISRGTEADRQLLTGQDPAVGEPIFVTDTNKLYIGKSGTTGGQIINPDQALNDLSNVNCPTPTNGQALVFSIFVVTVAQYSVTTFNHSIYKVFRFLPIKSFFIH